MAASLVFRLHDGGPELVREVLLERGWEEYNEREQKEEDWNLYWRVSAFRNSEYYNLFPWQRLNHHPKTLGITRKDCLARNLRRMRATFGSALYDFSPTVFILPKDHTHFLDVSNKLRLTRGLSVYWICKPVDLSRGRGIFIFEDIKDLVYDSPVIIQRYVSNPLLISGYKFDLRIYVCVKSFHPLTVYVHQEGLVRFATEKYSLSCLHNLYAHLTNTSINKLGRCYRANKESVGKGCKWTMSRFRYFLYSQGTDELLFWQRINNIVTLTLLTIAPSVPCSPNCVELFGFDILIDAKFKPWLLEVNSSPALTLDCPVDIAVKKGLIGDLIDLMNYTSVDSLRDRAYQRQGYKQPGVPNNQHSQAPRVSKRKPVSHSSQTQTLPLLKTISQHQPQKITKVAGYQRYRPPVDLNKVYTSRGRIFNTNITTATKHQTDQDLNLTLSPHSRTNMPVVVNRQTCPASFLMGNRTLRKSAVTNHNDTKTETEMRPSGKTDVSFSISDIPQRRFEPSAAPWKLPHIHSRPVQTPLERIGALNGHQIPPLRVGDFILTFPFNATTLKASQNTLDVKIIIQELHKLTCRLASGCKQSDIKKQKREKEEVKEDTDGIKSYDGEGDFESLFWGPKEPLLLSQYFKSS
ncbi:hypothetical protein LDENG_00246540 [Lucifuga dentata]|nr:hypothetical protein LDENG_00246540 [Lucifuga dentata]